MASTLEKKLSAAEEIIEVIAAEIIKRLLVEQLEILDAVEPKEFTPKHLGALEDLARIFKILKEDISDDIKAETFSKLGLKPSGTPVSEEAAEDGEDL